MTGVTPHGIHYPDGASKAKNLGPELKQMAEDIDLFIDGHFDPTDPLFRDTAAAAIATALTEKLKLAKAVHLEGPWVVWDGPNAATATHYVIPDHAGVPVVRSSPFARPNATPSLDW